MGLERGLRQNTYLRAELDVGRDNGDLADGDYQDGADDAQEAEDVVVAALVLPEALEDEHELYEQDRKRDQSSEQCPIRAAGVPRLDWDLAGNRVGLGGVVPRLGSEVAIPASHVDEGHLDQEPERGQADEGAEGDGGTRGLRPDEEVENKH